MRWLIWKELRLHWLILLTAGLPTLGPYLIPLVAYYRGTWVVQDNSVAISASLGLSFLTMALLGGHAIACERADRSAEFLAYLPISRGRIVLSKLILPLAVAAAIGGVNLTALMAAPGPSRFATPSEPIIVFAVAGFLAFSVAWLVSALQSSPTFAFAAGLAAPWTIAASLAFLVWLTIVAQITPATNESFVVVAFVVLATVLGIVCLAGGTWYYLRRVEP